jgi:hypothetical protein
MEAKSRRPLKLTFKDALSACAESSCSTFSLDEGAQATPCVQSVSIRTINIEPRKQVNNHPSSQLTNQKQQASPFLPDDGINTIHS